MYCSIRFSAEYSAFDEIREYDKTISRPQAYHYVMHTDRSLIRTYFYILLGLGSDCIIIKNVNIYIYNIFIFIINIFLIHIANAIYIKNTRVCTLISRLSRFIASAGSGAHTIYREVLKRYLFLGWVGVTINYNH